MPIPTRNFYIVESNSSIPASKRYQEQNEKAPKDSDYFTNYIHGRKSMKNRWHTQQKGFRKAEFYFDQVK